MKKSSMIDERFWWIHATIKLKKIGYSNDILRTEELYFKII